eukprot:CAMPEP_0206626966 /NCGR_PEP_ID=MMETSP0325_2-20121206/65644_1 /ASSEMBLY_ACC=CAM_ASM_000347 /TAXON_ID=2866 /ORGANISM="Crypthecodinium cohnii, Strain Seligo" /LENGTH=132 /DNA_ID=CAMNT_0054151439 /DNA_START=39 /DNA_END=434 /DNA_ORIENTATION=+
MDTARWVESTPPLGSIEIQEGVARLNVQMEEDIIWDVSDSDSEGRSSRGSSDGGRSPKLARSGHPPLPPRDRGIRKSAIPPHLRQRRDARLSLLASRRMLSAGAGLRPSEGSIPAGPPDIVEAETTAPDVPP